MTNYCKCDIWCQGNFHLHRLYELYCQKFQLNYHQEEIGTHKSQFLAKKVCSTGLFIRKPNKPKLLTIMASFAPCLISSIFILSSPHVYIEKFEIIKYDILIIWLLTMEIISVIVTIVLSLHVCYCMPNKNTRYQELLFEICFVILTCPKLNTFIMLSDNGC